MRFENENNRIYQILSRRENRTLDDLHELNSLLNSEPIEKIQSELDNTLLHFLTETTKASDEYLNFFHLKKFFLSSLYRIKINVKCFMANDLFIVECRHRCERTR